MDILTMKTKEKLGCNLCDRCCEYRGDIKLTPVNVCRISKYLKLTIKEFLDRYTERLENGVEVVIKATGDNKVCTFYNDRSKKCEINEVKPLQCIMFPLVPENLKRDYFYNSGECKCQEVKEIKVYDWLNSNNKGYNKNKKASIEWIEFIEWVDLKRECLLKEDLDNIYRIMFERYNLRNFNYLAQMRRNMKDVRKIILDRIYK